MVNNITDCKISKYNENIGKTFLTDVKTRISEKSENGLRTGTMYLKPSAIHGLSTSLLMLPNLFHRNDFSYKYETDKM